MDQQLFFTIIALIYLNANVLGIITEHLNLIQILNRDRWSQSRLSSSVLNETKANLKKTKQKKQHLNTFIIVYQHKKQTAY